jgi:hypothetical protein
MEHPFGPSTLEAYYFSLTDAKLDIALRHIIQQLVVQKQIRRKVDT